MTANAQKRAAVVVAADLTDIRKSWGWFLALGIVQIIVGTLTVGFAFSSTLTSVRILGVLLIIAAGAQMALAMLARD